MWPLRSKCPALCSGSNWTLCPNSRMCHSRSGRLRRRQESTAWPARPLQRPETGVSFLDWQRCYSLFPFRRTHAAAAFVWPRLEDAISQMGAKCDRGGRSMRLEPRQFLARIFTNKFFADQALSACCDSVDQTVCCTKDFRLNLFQDRPGSRQHRAVRQNDWFARHEL
jgi:hypothetical protein